MDVIETIHGRRSVRSYLPKAVDRGVIESLIWDAAQAPPPFAGQVPWTFNVIAGVERIAAMGTRAMDYAKAHRTDSTGSSWLDRPDFKAFWGAPVVIIISGNAGDCCRAGQNLMLSAHARGLGTCWVGSPMLWLGTEGAKAELRIPDGLNPAVALCLGYPDVAPKAIARERPPTIWAN
jgi:nitroreductase